MKDPKKLGVLLSIAHKRATLLGRERYPPYVIYLSRTKAKWLRLELETLASAFGVPLGQQVPEPRDDRGWEYLGIVLSDVHVYGSLPG